MTADIDLFDSYLDAPSENQPMSPVPAPSDLPVELRRQALEPHTPTLHRLVVCTLCSWYPWPVPERAGVPARRPVGHDHAHEDGQ